MINDDLLSKFERIEDLPVSEEMLGAYLEGNLRGAEMREVQNLINADNFVAEFSNMIEDDIFQQNLVDYGMLSPQNIEYFFSEMADVDFYLHELPLIDVDLVVGNQTSYFDELMHESGFNSFLDNDKQMLNSKEFDDDSSNNNLETLDNLE